MNRIKNTCLCALAGLAVFCTAACTRGPAQAFEPTEDSLYITGTGIRVSQLLAGVSAAAAAVVLALFYTGKLRHPPRYVDRGAGGQPDA